MADPPLRLDVIDFDELQQAIKNYPQDAEKVINEILHGEGSLLLQEEIRRLTPVSGKHWSGKKASAKRSKSLKDRKGHLFVDITTTSYYHYLYFPDDGSNTRRHFGNQHFFWRGAERKQDEIIERCIGRLTDI